MADTHRELDNNNVLFVDEGSQGQKTLQKWHYNDANEVREINILNSKPCFTALCSKLLPNTNVFFITHLTRSVKIFHSWARLYRNNLQSSFFNCCRYSAKPSCKCVLVDLESNLCVVLSDLWRIKINIHFKGKPFLNNMLASYVYKQVYEGAKLFFPFPPCTSNLFPVPSSRTSQNSRSKCSMAECEETRVVWLLLPDKDFHTTSPHVGYQCSIFCFLTWLFHL